MYITISKIINSKKKQPIIAFLPCRKGSKRIANKNTKPFAHYSNGLLEIKLNQLLDCNLIDKIIFSTDDIDAINYAKSLNSKRIEIHKRSEILCMDNTSTDALIGHISELVKAGDILWTHVTSPFITAEIYLKIIKSYFDCLDSGYDSLMTTTIHKKFFWTDSGPIYDTTNEKWPQTQTLKTFHEVNSGVFIANRDIYYQYQDRIGKRPKFYPLNKIISLDIDWPEEFTLAEQIFLSNLQIL